MSRALFLLVALFTFVAPSGGAVLGIDWGSESIKVAVVSITPKGQPLIDIVLNSQSKRKTPNSLTFRDGVRSMGSDSTLLLPRFPLHTIASSSLFAGVRASDSETIERLSSSLGLPLHISGDHRDATIFTVPSRPPPSVDSAPPIAFSDALNETTGDGVATPSTPSTLSVSVEASIAMLLGALKTHATQQCGKAITHAVFATRGDASTPARAAFETAAAMVGLSVLAFVPSGQAAGVAFSIQQGDRLHNTSSSNIPKDAPSKSLPIRMVTVLDVGMSATEATVLGFIPPPILGKGKKARQAHASKGVLKVLGYAHSDGVGGRVVDMKVASVLAKEYAEAKGKGKGKAKKGGGGGAPNVLAAAADGVFDRKSLWGGEGDEVSPRVAEGRAWARLLGSAKDVKERLSANVKVRAVVPGEATFDGSDHVFDFHRSAFVPHAAEPLEKVTSVMKKAVSRARVQLRRMLLKQMTGSGKAKDSRAAAVAAEAAADDVINASTVEFFGGGTRVPLLHDMMAGGLRVAAPTAELLLPRVVSMQLSPSQQIAAHNTAPPSVRVVFHANTTAPMRKLVTVKRDSDFNLTLLESSVSPAGRVDSDYVEVSHHIITNVTLARAAAIAKGNISDAAVEKGACDVVVALRINASSAVTLSSADVRCKVGPPPAKGKKSKQVTIPLLVEEEVKVVPQPMSQADLRDAAAQLDAFTAADQLRTAVAAARNALEGAVIECRAADPPAEVLARLEEVSEWVEFGDGADATTPGPVKRVAREVATLCADTLAERAKAAEEARAGEGEISEDERAEGEALRAERREARRRMREEAEADAQGGQQQESDADEVVIEDDEGESEQQADASDDDQREL